MFNLLKSMMRFFSLIILTKFKMLNIHEKKEKKTHLQNEDKNKMHSEKNVSTPLP